MIDFFKNNKKYLFFSIIVLELRRILFIYFFINTHITTTALMEAIERSNVDRSYQRGHLLPSDLELPDFLKNTSNNTAASSTTIKGREVGSTSATTLSPSHHTSSDVMSPMSSSRNSYELERADTTVSFSPTFTNDHLHNVNAPTKINDKEPRPPSWLL